MRQPTLSLSELPDAPALLWRRRPAQARLGITENTAKFHLKNILEKLHAESRVELATRAVREGLLVERG